MATMITSDCINCGACEPECPNNAISQGDPVYVIDPQLCTECVGFHDYEACAAVCPVDVCVTDPNNIESEEVLIARARALHPETDFGNGFQSRFRKAQSDGAAAATEKAAAGEPFENLDHLKTVAGEYEKLLLLRGYIEPRPEDQGGNGENYILTPRGSSLLSLIDSSIPGNEHPREVLDEQEDALEELTFDEVASKAQIA